MKKVIVVLVVLVVFLAGVLVAIPLIFMDPLIKAGVEAAGPKVAKVDIKLSSVRLSVLSGSGEVRGLVIGNPEGYKTPSAIQVGHVDVALKPRSLFSDKIVIRRVNVVAPEITYEGGLQNSNLKKIMDNIQAATGGPSAATPGTEPGKKLQIDEFTLTGGKVSVSTGLLGGKPVSVPLPDIQLRDLGTGPEGITGAEVMRRVFSELQGKVTASVAGIAGKVGQQAIDNATDVGKSATKGIEDLTKGVGGLLKKK